MWATSCRSSRALQGGGGEPLTFYLGYDEDEQVDYGLGPKSKKDFLEALRAGIELTGQREVARRSGVSRRTIARLMEGHLPRGKVLAKIIKAINDS
jgi:hypothetical protein